MSNPHILDIAYLLRGVKCKIVFCNTIASHSFKKDFLEFKKKFIVIQLQVSAFSPHPSTPPQPNPPRVFRICSAHGCDIQGICDPHLINVKMNVCML